MDGHLVTLMTILPLLYIAWPNEEELKKRAQARKKRLARERRHPPTTVAALKGGGKRHADIVGMVVFYLFVPAFEFKVSLEQFILTGLAMFILWSVLIQRQINDMSKE